MQATVFVNDGDGQVRAAHKILGYPPVQKSFADARHVISANRPWLPKITVVETGFLISQEPSVPVNIPPVGPSSSHQVAEDEGELDRPEEGFGVFDLVHQSEDPSGDIGDPALSEAELSSIGTFSQAEMGLKRKPPTPLLQLLEGQPGKDTQGTPQPEDPSHHLGLRLSRPGPLPPSHSHNPPAPNFLLPPNQFGLLDLKALIQRERGVQRARKLWTGENPNLLRRRRRLRALNN